MSEINVSQERLWWIAAGPSIWAVHFLAVYITISLVCPSGAGAGTGLGWVRWAILGYTVGAGLGIGAIGVRGWRRHRLGNGQLPHDDDTPEDRTRFLGFATLLLCGLSMVGILYVGLVAAFFETCR